MAVYTLFGQPAAPAPLTVDTSTYTMGVQFSTSQAGTLTAVWFYSPSTATVLPVTIALYAVSGSSLVHSETASWSGAAGSGWVRAPFSSPPSLTASTAYKAVVLKSSAGASFYGAVSHYWDTGSGSGGVSNGTLSAPNNASAAQGQDTYHAGTSLSYPGTTSNASNYWVDPEVTVTSLAGTVIMSGTGSLTAGAVKKVPGSAALAGLGVFTAAGQKTVPGAVSAAGAGYLSAAGQKSVPGAAALAGTGQLGGTPVHVVAGAAALSGAGALAAGGFKTVPGAAALSGAGILAAGGSKAVPGAAALSGTGILTAGGIVRMSGSYTLFDQPPSPAMIAGDANDYTFGVQFYTSAAVTLSAVWFYSPEYAAALPGEIALYQVSGQVLVHSEAASWSGTAGSGWVRAAFGSPPLLTASTAYKACVLQNAGGTWYSSTPLYWSSGPGGSGIVNGLLSAPDDAGADGGQDSFNVNPALAYPASSYNAANYWVDPEITTSGIAFPGAAVLAGEGVLGAAAAKIVPGAAVLAGTGTMTPAAGKTAPGAAVLSGSGTLTAGAGKAVPGAVVLSGAGALAAAASEVASGAAALSGLGTLAGTAMRQVPAAAALAGAGIFLAAGAVPPEVKASASFTASAVLTCSYLSARILMAANTMFPGNQLGTYGASEAETTVTVPGVTDGIYTA